MVVGKVVGAFDGAAVHPLYVPGREGGKESEREREREREREMRKGEAAMQGVRRVSGAQTNANTCTHWQPEAPTPSHP